MKQKICLIAFYFGLSSVAFALTQGNAIWAGAGAAVALAGFLLLVDDR